MKIRSSKNKKSNFLKPSVKDYIDLIHLLIIDIKECDEEFSQRFHKDYAGIISTRTAPKLKKLLPDVYKELDLQ